MADGGFRFAELLIADFFRVKRRFLIFSGMKGFLLLLLLVTGIGGVRAGWYDCYNFKGMIGSYPITVSVQLRPGYFGEAHKKHFNVVGVYAYDKYHQPIRLEGMLDTTTKQVILYELQEERYTATLQFSLAGGDAGVWRDSATHKTLPLMMQLVSRLQDIHRSTAFSDVEMLQFQSLPDVFFIGVYSKAAGMEDAEMKTLKIVGKKDGQVRQVLDLTNEEVAAGNLMTIIYDNVWVVKPVSKRGFIVHNKLGRIGAYQVVNYDAGRKRFVVQREIVVEGN